MIEMEEAEVSRSFKLAGVFAILAVHSLSLIHI